MLRYVWHRPAASAIANNDPALASGALFSQVRAAPAAFTARQRAERAALTLVALAPARMAHLPLIEQVFAGAQTG